MTFEKRQEILAAIREAGKRGSRVEFMRIVADFPIDFATATAAFREGLERNDNPPDTGERAASGSPGSRMGTTVCP